MIQRQYGLIERANDQHAGQAIAKLPHVPRPFEAFKESQQLGLAARNLAAAVFANPTQQEFDQQWDILAPLSQGWQSQLPRADLAVEAFGIAALGG